MVLGNANSQSNTNMQANNLMKAHNQAQMNSQVGHAKRAHVGHGQLGAKQAQVAWHALTHFKSQ